MQDTITLALIAAIAVQTSYLCYRQLNHTNTSKAVPVFVDTSVLMDGRIVQVAEAGFIPGKLVIPRSVVGELQLLADGGDNEKRERARRGLDVVKVLQAIEYVVVEILQDGSRTENGVDDQLLHLAKKYRGMICTIDFNLNKVAQVEKIRVLNINELAQQLRMTYMPGDHVQLELKHQGSDSHQAVGHLPDGTMVVVEQARSQIGKTVDVEVIRSLQTHAGRMMFARVSSRTMPTSAGLTPSKAKKLSSSRPVGRAPKPASPTASSTQTPRTPRVAHDPSPRDRRAKRSTTPQESTNNPRSSTATHSSSRRPRSAKQSEASLIELVNNQRQS